MQQRRRMKVRMRDSTLDDLIERISLLAKENTSVIEWGSPVPMFGRLDRSRVATLGLNPSNREFVDAGGRELCGGERRFHTLASLSLAMWSDATAAHRQQIVEACTHYFTRNPYDGWFRKLDKIIMRSGSSYYAEKEPACHLDLIPYATSTKWSALRGQQRSTLLRQCDTLGMLVRDSDVRVLVLNGASVVSNLQKMTSGELMACEMSGWELPRSKGPDVAGYAYKGWVRRIAGVDLGRDILVLGYNHNIQSSFGVTTRVIDAISEWIGAEVRGIL